MTQDEIIEMAIKARLVARIDECHRAIRPKWIEDHDITTYVETFAKLVAAKEREACAKLCETLGVHPALNVWCGGPDWYKHGKDCAAAIRARGQA
jgi:hypothetical protein